MGDANTTTSEFNFNRGCRLTRPEQFARVFDQAERSRDRFFTVLFRSSGRDAPRLGFAIAKKRISLASGRNRLRRLARESFRKKRTALPAYDIIILAQPAAAAATNKDLFASLERHWQRLSDNAKRKNN